MIDKIRTLFGKNFIGPEELNKVCNELNISPLSTLPGSIPEIPFSDEVLKSSCDTHILLLGATKDAEGKLLSLTGMRDFFGTDSSVQEPCFYNQDWYVNEKFANECTIEFKWYLLKKELIDSSRGKTAEESKVALPSALLTVFTFFVYYFHANEYLWSKDFVWCADIDSNGDRIYTGRYFDPQGMAKNGFSVHRHLRIKQHYGSIDMIK